MRYRTAAGFRQALEERLKSTSTGRQDNLLRVRKLVTFERFVARVQAVAPNSVGRLQRRRPPRMDQSGNLLPADFEEIIATIEDWGHSIERNPPSRHSASETDLRNQLLSALNAAFGLGATGETFSKRGKSDLFLRVPSGAAFLAECKKWRGPKAHMAAIDQIFDYLTVSESFAAIVSFVPPGGNMVRRMECLRARLQGISHFRSCDPSDSTHVTTVHCHPDDASRSVTVDHLLFVLSPRSRRR